MTDRCPRYPRPLAAAVLSLAAVASLAAAPAPAAAESPPHRPPVVEPVAVAAPPVAPVEPRTTTLHGVELVDPYAWLRERDAPRVRAHVEAENAYAEAATAHLGPLRERLYEELAARVVEEDESAPVRRGDWLYYTRTAAGAEYPVHYRRKAAPGAPEEVVLDVEELARGYDHLRVTNVEPSPDHQLLAYAVDTTGDEDFELRVREIATGRVLPDVVPAVGYSVAWADDSATLFYATREAGTRRQHRILRHRLGTPVADDPVVFEETDPAFAAGVRRSRSGEMLFILTGSIVTSEELYLPSDRPEGTWRVVEPRVPGVEYRVDHAGEHFYLRTNRGGAADFEVVRRPVAGSPGGGADGAAADEVVVPHRPGVTIAGHYAFPSRLVTLERSAGPVAIRVHDLAAGTATTVPLPEPVHAVRATDNEEIAAGVFRFTYTSPVTPRTTFDYHLADGRLEEVDRDEVPDYDPARYRTERIYARAPDGVAVPITLLYRRGLERDGRAPCLLVGYGAYGISYDPTFSAARLPLLERGFVYAIAHVRGGGDLGEAWHEGGRMLTKKNTFTDLVAAAEQLVASGWTSPERLALSGGSAGGLLVGAVLNLRPDLFGAAVAQVPFVDLMNTMLDPSIPLTVGEFDEWGNPRDPEYFRYMLSYSPYDNVAALDYPALLVTAGWNDPRVPYWEAAKWVARLRAERSVEDDDPILLRIDLGTGHAGASGRYRSLEEKAFEYAFLLEALGVEEAPEERTSEAAEAAYPGR